MNGYCTVSEFQVFNGPAAQGENATGSEIHVCGYLLPFQAVQIVFAKSAVFGGVQLHKHGIDLRKQGIKNCQLRVGTAFGFFFTLYCPGEALPILAAARRSAEVLGDVPGGFLRLCQPVGEPLIEPFGFPIAEEPVYLFLVGHASSSIL